MVRGLRHLDLCSGIGGFKLAAEWAGFQTVGFSEVEPYCCRLLEEKWPEIRNHGDIRRADFSALRGSIDVLSAGVPCQPASCAGKRRGSKDYRWLWPSVCTVVGYVQPDWCLFENPPGILSLDEFRGVLLRLESLGYQVRTFSVPANAVGAKHRRQRVFIVAHAGRARGQNGTGWGSPAGSGPCTDAERSGEDGEAVADAGSQRCQEREERNGEPKQIRIPSRGNDVERCGLRSGFRLTQPPLCRRADGIPDRSHRLKALGNACVPQQAYPFFAAIAATIT